MSTTELRREIKKAVDKLPPARLESLADYVDFLIGPGLGKRRARRRKRSRPAKGSTGAGAVGCMRSSSLPKPRRSSPGRQAVGAKARHCFSVLERDPRRHNNIKRLSGEHAGFLRFRVGDWRVIYRIDDAGKRVLVLSIANRREAY